MSDSTTISECYALDGDKMKYRLDWKDRTGGNGFGLSTDGSMYTLTIRDRHMVGIVFEDESERSSQCA